MVQFETRKEYEKWKEGRNSPSNKRKAYTGILFVLILGFFALIVYLLIGPQPFWRMFDRDITRQYNNRLSEANAIFQEHELLTKQATLKDVAKANSFATEYSKKIEHWVPLLSEFKIFIESNDKRIRRVGINPDYFRDNVKNTLAAMRENEARFHKEADQFKEQANQPAKDAIAALQKLEARFIAGISYRDYAPVLGETFHQVRVFWESTGAAEKPELVASIKKVLFHYAMIKEVWDDEFKESERKDPNLAKKVASSYPEVGQRRNYNYIINVIFKEASQELRKASNLIQEKSVN